MAEPHNILALDTSTEACVAALKCGELIEERFSRAPRQHHRLLLPAVEELLRSAGIGVRDLDLVVFGRGPGSFTGIRIATGVVQGLAFGLSLPVVPVSTLACLAQGRLRRAGNQRIAVAMHARQDEIYWASYIADAGAVRLAGEEALLRCAQVALPDQGAWVGVGDGWALRGELEQALGRAMESVELDVYPRGEDLIELGMRHYSAGEAVSAREATPVYLREKVAAKKGE